MGTIQKAEKSNLPKKNYIVPKLLLSVFFFFFFFGGGGAHRCVSVGFARRMIRKLVYVVIYIFCNNFILSVIYENLSERFYNERLNGWRVVLSLSLSN